MPIPLSDFPSDQLPSSLKEDLILIVVLKPKAKVQSLQGAIFVENPVIALEMAKQLSQAGSTARAVVVLEQ